MRIRRPPGGHVVDVLFILALFCVFAVCSMLVIVIGAEAYTNSLDRMETAFDSRTTLSYVANKIHYHDTAGGVSLGELGGVPALVLRQDLNDQTFTTYIYHHEGMLKELMIGPESVAGPESGQGLIEVYALEMAYDDAGLLHFACVDESGGRTEMLIAPRAAA